MRDIAYFYSEAKSTFIVTRDGKNYVLDDSLDAIEAGLDPKAFFRISRGAIIAENVIDSASKLLGGRLRPLGPVLLYLPSEVLGGLAQAGHADDESGDRGAGVTAHKVHAIVFAGYAHAFIQLLYMF